MDLRGFRGWRVDVSFRYTGNTDFDDLVCEVIERIKRSYSLTSEAVINMEGSRVGFIGLRAEPLINFLGEYDPGKGIFFDLRRHDDCYGGGDYYKRNKDINSDDVLGL